MTSRQSASSSPLASSGSTMTGPVDPGASAAVALNAVIASTVDSAATTMPVRVAGRPSFERLRHRITFSFHSNPGSLNWMPGNGWPYAASTISGTRRLRASASRRCSSSSDSTLPEGLVGRDTQIAATSGTASSPSKRTWYLKNPSGNSSIAAACATSMPSVRPRSA